MVQPLFFPGGNIGDIAVNGRFNDLACSGARPIGLTACSFLGLDPLQVANEGKLVVFVDPAHTDAVVAAMRATPEGAAATVIGRVVAAYPGMAVGRTPFGTMRVIERELGEQLPRIC
ncbi:MAG: AIR synthase-related protein [Mycobacterium sp.]